MRGPGFTVTELLVAVAVLVILLAATGAMFHTASAVAGRGRAAADILQETAAIEDQIRRDFERVSREGFLAIRCVAVPNDVNAAGGTGALLDPALAPDAVIRADQLVFFTRGVHSIQTLRGGAGADRRAQSAAARVYYGHAYQVPDGPPAEHPPSGDDVVWAIDPEPGLDKPIVPWTAGPRQFARVRFQGNASDPPGDYVVEGGTRLIDATQPPAARWLLVRHAAALADDGGSPAVFLFRLGRGGFRSTASLGDDAVRHGRVDAVAAGLDDIRFTVVGGAGFDPLRTWLQQRSTVADLVFYPRAERAAPGPYRVDQALTAHVLAGACSSFVVDWTWADGVGDAANATGERFRGIPVAPDGPQPWFGLDPAGTPGGSRGVQTLRSYLASCGPAVAPETVRVAAIEQMANTLTTEAGRAIQDCGAVVYEAIFGYNRTAPLAPDGRPWPSGPEATVAYTPWPTALRITMTLRDPAGRQPSLREVQFVVCLD